ncbi:MAG: PqqD family protein [Alphaproteobacteria bacterium]|nr:MAG: PqqD family protein [Alphaproteobacteria bacterium]
MLVTRTEGLIEAEVDGEIVALHVETGTCYGFNLPATRIWALLERPMTVEELSAALAEEFEGDAGEIERDVRDLVEDLRKDGLVSVSG